MTDTRSLRELIACQKPGWSLEQRFYTDPEIFRLELEQIVARNWIFVGHRSQLANDGDFLVATAANESAIVINSGNGNIRAFANVCRHRGSLICLEQAGSVRKLQCPYHGWVYGIDGKLLAARDMREGFRMEDFSLHSMPVEDVHGLLFVCFGDKPHSINAAREELARPMAMFDFENLKVAAKRTYPIAANWKLAVENYQECYHCASAHPDYAKMHTLMLDAKKRDRLQARMRERMDECGLVDYRIDHLDESALPGEMGFGYWRTALFEGYKTGSRDGLPVAPLLGNLKEYDGGASDMTFGPFSHFLAYSDHVVAYVFTPVDERNCQCEISWMVRGDAVEGKDYDREELTWLWHVTTLADEEIIVNNWKGVNSKFYRPGPFSGMELPEQRFVNWLLHQLRRSPKVTS